MEVDFLANNVQVNVEGAFIPSKIGVAFWWGLGEFNRISYGVLCVVTDLK